MLDRRPQVPTHDPVLANATILIVDDNETNIRVLEGMLRHAGATTLHCLSDSRQAVPACVRLQPDIVLLDLHMPGLDGFAVMTELAEVLDRDDFVPVVVLTADNTTETRTRVLAAGASDFLTKPLDHLEVVLRVRNLLQTRALHVRLQRHRAGLEEKIRQQDERDAQARHRRDAKHRQVLEALEPGSMAMVFQPIVHLDSGHVAGFEALARFRCEPDRSPDAWFAEAAEVGLGTALELAAVELAIQEFATTGSDAYLSVNVSPQTALSPELDALARGDVAERLVFEITEHAAVRDYDHLISRLGGPRARGIRIAVDDTGAGFASLQHILRLRPDIIKLDMALTRGIDVDPVRRSLAAALVSFGQELRAHVVAEGVETERELETLRLLGIRYGQGFCLGRPAPAVVFARSTADATAS